MAEFQPEIGSLCGGVTPSCPTQPVLFVGHGAPMLALDVVKGAQLRSLIEGVRTPDAIIVVSAHWETRSPTIGSVLPRPLMYDYSGFPASLYQLRYAAPTAPELGRRVESLLRPWSVSRAAERGLDHGAWLPLLHMYPSANVPVLQVSLPSRLSASDLIRLGRALAPLRRENVLTIASGSITHNLRLSRYEDPSPPPAWAIEFDEWTKNALARWDLDSFANYRRCAPALHVAHPTEEHFLPLLIAVGVASEKSPQITFAVEGFEHRSLSRRSVRID
ncbi:MAG: dioxygenase [Polyangiaceae bacterium]|nr:dioxygenase [Polyangiaceae bacterium]